MSYLTELHPELLAARPRPGGLAVIKHQDSRGGGSRPSSRPGSRSGSARGSRTTLRSTPTKKSSKTTMKSTFTGASMFDSTLYGTSSSHAPKKTSREYRIKKAMSISPWFLYKDEEDPDNVLPPDPLHDSMTILSMAVSTIMLLAAGHRDIPREHLLWTLSYLECVKDDYGFAPPNVQGVLNHIRLLDNTLNSFLFDDLEDEEDVIFVKSDKAKGRH
ncbi:hypothetical protein NQ315_011786 [Exocentrus adspersus]|uniref:Uncharacterized protein n=1 Tax=Exocentrus adspersus TaxID=1586481 RepID=A0AAV8W1D5_9CUCU|nr:hypothetical protein NQ315_011786 [Exocentrus adspersus]